MPPPVAGSVRDLVLYRALRLAQVTQAPQRWASQEQLQDALGAFNDLIETLDIQPDAIFTADSAQYHLKAGQQSYTIGPDPANDFNAPRPLEIADASVVIATATFTPIEIVDVGGWTALSVRNVTSTYPTQLYCDYDAPAAHLWFWPIPSQACTVELWTWQALPKAATVDSLLAVPPGYGEMLVYQLAVRLADQFATPAMANPRLESMANRLLGRVKAHNSSAKAIGSVDAGTSAFPSGSGGDFNWMTGQPG